MIRRKKKQKIACVIPGKNYNINTWRRVFTARDREVRSANFSDVIPLTPFCQQRLPLTSYNRHNYFLLCKCSRGWRKNAVKWGPSFLLNYFKRTTGKIFMVASFLIYGRTETFQALRENFFFFFFLNYYILF